MWRGLVEWAKANMSRPGFELARPQDMEIPCCVDNGCASRGRYPRPPCTLVDFAGQEFLRRGCTKSVIAADLVVVGRPTRFIASLMPSAAGTHPERQSGGEELGVAVFAARAVTVPIGV